MVLGSDRRKQVEEAGRNVPEDVRGQGSHSGVWTQNPLFSGVWQSVFLDRIQWERPAAPSGVPRGWKNTGDTI